MITIRIESTKLEARLRRISKRLIGDIERMMEQIGRILVKATKSNVNNKLLRVRSGRLLGSIKKQVYTPAGRVVLEVSSDTPYSRIQNYGGFSGKHRIKPTYYMSRTIGERRKQINSTVRRAVKRSLR